jgi:peptidoglycan/xylan/chitin deacetylase (PgdA/CDA1 family)
MKQIFTMDVEQDIDAGVRFARFLTKKGLVGEFYITGALVEKYPSKVGQIAEHHILGGHGYNHEDFAKLNDKKAKHIIKKTISVFKQNHFEMCGWRFPYLSYSNSQLNLIAKYGLYDSSIYSPVWSTWGRMGFIRNWARNLMRGIITLPYPYSFKLKERPWSVADLNDRGFYYKKGRLICHCYNLKNFEVELYENFRD